MTNKAKIWLVCLIANFVVIVAPAQTVLPLQNFLDQVRNFHPLIRNAELGVQTARAQKLEAGGAFDPILDANVDRKTFDGKSYYVKPEAGLTIPTWFGVEVYGGISDYSGTYLNAEETSGIMSYTGLKLPVLKNLYFDKRRAVLQQAKFGISQSENDRQGLINDLLTEAELSYWKWLQATLDFQITREQLETSENRLDFFRASFEGGDRSAMDTLEAVTQVLSLQQELLASDLRISAAVLDLATFLWDESGDAVFLRQDLIPDTTLFLAARLDLPLDADALSQVEELVESHPKIAAYDWKQKMLEVDRKLKFQSFLPKLDLKYNILQKGNFGQVFRQELDLFGDNYKYGISFSVPLVNRAAIGAFRASNFKIEANELSRDNSFNVLKNKALYYQTEMSSLNGQIQMAEANLSRYQTLAAAEFQRFQLGDSSVFLLNSREMKVLEMRRKVLDLSVKLGSSQTKWRNALGLNQ